MRNLRQMFRAAMRTWLLGFIFIGTAGTLRAEFLVPDREYRCPPSDQNCKSPHNLSSQEEHHTPAGNAFTINFVEYKDNGDIWNERELTDALYQIRNARGGQDNSQSVLVMVYIHGWQNNADEQPDNCNDVCRFRDRLLPRLADEYATDGGSPLKVVGVYLAWRGLTFTKEPFKHVVSYWPRRGVAHHVGQTGMFNALIQIERVVGESRQHYVLVLAGHSFGARVLEYAAEISDHKHEGFMLKYRKQAKKIASSQGRTLVPDVEAAHALNPKLPADLIVYVNAATASTVTRKTLRDIRDTCTAAPRDPICGADPVYLAISSHADLATGIILPIANLVFPALASDHLHIISAANTPWLHTHTDPVKGCDRDAALCFQLKPGNPPQMESIERVDRRSELPGGIKAEPFWIFNVNCEVMSNHGDVWNEVVTDLITRVITRTPKFQALSKDMGAKMRKK